MSRQNHLTLAKTHIVFGGREEMNNDAILNGGVIETNIVTEVGHTFNGGTK